jgi:multiple sugar transport system ATP-binding protein
LPRTLSGGEKQRVALARCLSHSPRVLLLDEPFSNLDAALRQKTRGEVKKLVDRFGLTTVFVTHDQTEAVTMGHRIAVMQQGRIEQVGTYHELYREPLNMFVAGFLGSPPMNFFPARRQGTSLRLEISSQQLDLPLPDSLQHRIPPNESVTIGARPEHLHPTRTAVANALPGIVEMVEPSMSDAMQTLLLRHGQDNLYAKIDMQQPVRSGETLWCQFPPQHLYYFDREGKRF